MNATLNPASALPDAPDQPQEDPMPQAPASPEADACCHSGCVHCVEDLYTEALQHYRAELAAWQARQGRG